MAEIGCNQEICPDFTLDQVILSSFCRPLASMEKELT